jgi:hypothetical protein
VSAEQADELLRIARNEAEYQQRLAKQTPPPEERHQEAQRLFSRALALSTSDEVVTLREGFADATNALALFESLEGHGGAGLAEGLQVYIGHKLERLLEPQQVRLTNGSTASTTFPPDRTDSVQPEAADGRNENGNFLFRNAARPTSGLPVRGEPSKRRPCNLIDGITGLLATPTVDYVERVPCCSTGFHRGWQ